LPDYNFTITVPANTSKDNPVKVEATLTKGVLAGGQIFFPPGCHGLCHVTINDVNGQLYPANAEDNFHGDTFPVELLGRYKLDTAPFKLYIHAWNEDDTYQHTPQVALHVLTEEEMYPFEVLKEFVTLMKRLMGLV